MREFFHGWRRKAGCVAMLMALFIIVLWLRSYVVFDIVGIGSYSFGSTGGWDWD